MPVLLSAVMLLEYTVPNGVSIARPPANGAPPIAVWHAMQSPTTTRYAPRPPAAGTAAAVCVFARLPHSSGSFDATRAALVPAGTGCDESHAVNTDTSAGAKRRATSAMQSGSTERSLP